MPAAMVLCVVKGCDNKSKVYSIIMFHRIPTKNKKRKNQWLAALNIDLKTPVESIKKWRVCSEHFGPDDYLVNMDSITRTTVRRLKDTQNSLIITKSQLFIFRRSKCTMYTN
uniref:THAP domain-containing protein 1 n=2 Tax=Cyprinus carpio TaxID=7962 RepID=A0A8C2JPB8_CYPCA